MKITIWSMLLYLIFCLIEVHPQTFPFVRFLGNDLPNHTYVDFTLVGDEGENSVQCYTDLTTCCTDVNGPHRGDWYFPSGEMLSENSDISESEGTSNVQVRHRNNATTGGIYRCEIETSASHNSGREVVYAGLYSSGGSVTIPRGLRFREVSDLNGESPQFTLTCTSTGGPATNVSWRRDSKEVLGGLTVLNDPETAEYIHTLTVTGRLPGNYRCSVSNNKPSTAVNVFNVRAASAPTNLMAVQEGPTGIRVSWTPPSPLRFTRGYRIFYIGGSSGSVDISDRNTDNYLLTDLVNGASYTISIMGTSHHLPSERVEYPNTITLISVLDMLNAMVSSTTVTSISLSWSVPSGSTVERYEIVWEKNFSEECLEEDVGNAAITDGSTSYSIIGLEEGSSYTISVTATNMFGNVVSDLVTGMTAEAAPSAPPSSVRMSDVTSSSITVQWAAVECIHRNGAITGYTVQYAKWNGRSESKNVSGGNATEAVLTGLADNTTYYIEVAAVNSAGIGVYSTAMLFPGIPITVVGSVTSKTIFLSWSVPRGSVMDSYVICWKRDASEDCPYEDVGSTTVTDGSTNYNIAGLEEGSSYSITVTATNMFGTLVSDPVTGMTGEVVPSAPPTNVSISDVTSSSITVQWGAVDCIHRNGKITGYSVQYGEQGHVSLKRMTVFGGNTMEATIHELTNNFIYSVSVAAVNSGGIGKYSHSIRIQTAGNLSPSIKDCDGTGKVGASAVGGFVGGVLITAVLGIVIHLLLVRRMREGQKGQMFMSTNQAYGHVTRGEVNTEYEMPDTISGAAMATEESIYETVPT